jgi:hypothetical protein
LNQSADKPLTRASLEGEEGGGRRRKEEEGGGRRRRRRKIYRRGAL